MKRIYAALVLAASVFLSGFVTATTLETDTSPDIKEYDKWITVRLSEDILFDYYTLKATVTEDLGDKDPNVKYRLIEYELVLKDGLKLEPMKENRYYVTYTCTNRILNQVYGIDFTDNKVHFDPQVKPEYKNRYRVLNASHAGTASTIPVSCYYEYYYQNELEPEKNKAVWTEDFQIRDVSGVLTISKPDPAEESERDGVYILPDGETQDCSMNIS